MTRRELFPLALAPLASTLVPAFGQVVPRPAEELLVNSLTGGKMSLKALRGKVVCVELLLTTCSHCQSSARALQELYAELKPKGFEVLGAATNTSAVNAKTDIGDFLGITAAKFPIGWIPMEQSYAFLQHPMAKQLFFPQLLIVDRKGNVVFQHMGSLTAADLRPEIMKALGSGTPAAPAKRPPLSSKKQPNI